jgi:tRNA A-37 threonylcarbamoyl transferase component Bud32
MFFKRNNSEILKNFERYRIPSGHANAVYRVPHAGQFIFLKIYGHKHPRLTYETRKFLSSFGLRQPVEYSSPIMRKNFEEKILACWKTNGYNVPDILKNPLPELSVFPVLTTKFIDGMTLNRLIREEKVSMKEKERNLSALFCEIDGRHGSAFLKNDNRLFHVDANTRNIIYTDKIIYHVDFEMGRPWESVMDCASREVLKLLVSIGEDIEPARRETVFKLFKDCYKKAEVYQFIREGVVQRPFQRIHLLRNMKKKKKDPNRVTLYDVLQYLGTHDV